MIDLKEFKKHFKVKDQVFVGFTYGQSFGYIKGFNEEGFWLTQINNSKPLFYTWNQFEVIVHSGLKIYPEKGSVVDEATKIIMFSDIEQVRKTIDKCNKSIVKDLKIESSIKKKLQNMDLVGEEREYNIKFIEEKTKLKVLLCENGYEHLIKKIIEKRAHFTSDTYTEIWYPFSDDSKEHLAVNMYGKYISLFSLGREIILRSRKCEQEVKNNWEFDDGKWDYKTKTVSSLKEIEKILSDSECLSQHVTKHVSDPLKSVFRPPSIYYSGDPWRIEAPMVKPHVWMFPCGGIAIGNYYGDIHCADLANRYRINI